MLHMHRAALLDVTTHGNSFVFWWSVQRHGYDRTSYSLWKRNCVFTGVERGGEAKKESTQRYSNKVIPLNIYEGKLFLPKDIGFAAQLANPISGGHAFRITQHIGKIVQNDK